MRKPKPEERESASLGSASLSMAELDLEPWQSGSVVLLDHPISKGLGCVLVKHHGGKRHQQVWSWERGGRELHGKVTGD